MTMNLWTALLDVLILLAAALLLGAMFERLKQNAILGYLLAGTLLGPSALDLVPNHEAVTGIAELGVALLLFVIGLEFSWSKLRSIGAIALGGGVLQVTVTTALGMYAAAMCGLEIRAAFAVGAIIALSSTAVVIRLLVQRTEIDSVHGRNALGILLLQDIAVVPLLLAVTILAGRGSPVDIGWAMARALGMVALLTMALYLLTRTAAWLLGTRTSADRETPVLLAVVTAVGSAWGAHALGLSPVLGAFMAGVMLAESPFATQIRADVAPLKTLFVTLFFSSIGMMTNPTWAIEHWKTVTGLVAAVILGKMILTSGVVRLFRFSAGHSLATGICLAQLGEFSFVLADQSRQHGLIGGDLFELIISATVLSLFASPYLIALAPRVSRLFSGQSAATVRPPKGEEPPPVSNPNMSQGPIALIGFGPAGRRVAEDLKKAGFPLVAIELNSRSAADAQAMEIPMIVGDATSLQVLKHAGIEAVRAVALTIPDPATARQITSQIHAMAPEVRIIARARYHRFRADLELAGATTVVDEEMEVGYRIAAEIRALEEANSDIRS
jgi:monovalent cation:H+ antiporter-2, CPA2 family